MERSDEEIAIACGKSSLQEFDHLYTRYNRQIYAFVSRRTSDRAVAEDLTSMIFLKALEHIRSFSPRKGSFRTWLYRIARNVLIDSYRSNTLRQTEDIETAWDLPAEQSPDQDLHAGLRDGKLHSALAALKPLQREIVLLRIWEDLSYSEIAQITGKSEASAKMLFSRTMKELRTVLPPLSFLLLFLRS